MGASGPSWRFLQGVQARQDHRDLRGHREMQGHRERRGRKDRRGRREMRGYQEAQVFKGYRETQGHRDLRGRKDLGAQQETQDRKGRRDRRGRKDLGGQRDRRRAPPRVSERVSWTRGSRKPRLARGQPAGWTLVLEAARTAGALPWIQPPRSYQWTFRDPVERQPSAFQ